jgi:polynucleotide 5'-kinase involved in rRNA processing
MQRTTREIRIVSLSALNGLIVALFEKDDSPVSLGILRKIDFPGKKATVTTIIRLNEVARVEVGRVKLSPEGYEIGTAEIRRVILPSNSERASALERD